MWDPRFGLAQQGSFLQPVVPPASQPCDPPLFCFQINADWVPYVLGAMMQLVQPGTWEVGTEADRNDAIGRATDLIAVVANAGPCAPPVPPLPGSTVPLRACSVAGYITQVVIRESIQKAIDAIQADQTVLGYGILIIGMIPGAGLVINFLIRALDGLYNAMVSGTLTHYQDALNDPTLFSRLTCAIYGAIAADGQITDANFPAILTAISGVSYTHAEVITAIHDYVQNVGATGMEQLQVTGALAVYDCTGCGGGVSTGPAGIEVTALAGSVSVTILTGNGYGSVSVAFSRPFPSAPILTVTSSDENLIASYTGLSGTGFTAELAAALPVLADTTATVDWMATPRGAR